MKILDEYENHERKISPSEPRQISGDPKYVLDVDKMVLIPIGEEANENQNNQ